MLSCTTSFQKIEITNCLNGLWQRALEISRMKGGGKFLREMENMVLRSRKSYYNVFWDSKLDENDDETWVNAYFWQRHISSWWLDDRTMACDGTQNNNSKT